METDVYKLRRDFIPQKVRVAQSCISLVGLEFLISSEMRSTIIFRKVYRPTTILT
jgi:hypothetical protein